jgi:DNA-binding transcriptional LysR family regulator
MASSVSQPPALFDWALARSFLAVLDAGSLMGAARQLGMHQPTLSRHIAELEAQLGVPLFERTGRGAAPTAMALALADGARQMQTGAQAVAHAATRSRNQPSGTVRVSASEVAATWLLPPLLAALADDEPGLQVELVVSNQLSNLLKREADIALRMLRPAQTSLTARKLGEVAITACAHERYLARAGVPRSAKELAQHRLIGYDRDDTIVRGFARLGFPVTREQFALRTDNQLTYGQWVAAGAGIGFLARYHAALLPGVRAVLPSLRIPPLPCWLAVHREIRGNRLVRRVWDYLAEAVPVAIEAGSNKSR